MTQHVAIIGAGPAGLMAAEVLSQYGYDIQVFEQKPSAARKFLMAGKTGLNISHAEPVEQFIQRYDQVEWLAPWVKQWDATWIQNWMQGLGIEPYIGSSGRVFPTEMKAAPLLRAWLRRLAEQGIKFFYRHQVLALNGKQLSVRDLKQQTEQSLTFDAIILACGAVSWSQLGSDGAWQKWLSAENIEPFQASNAGVERSWSPFMQPIFGQPLKRVEAWVEQGERSVGDIVISHYGLESGLVYKQGRALRQQLKQQQKMCLMLDLLPNVSEKELAVKLQPSKKQSLSNVWRKAGLDATKSTLLRELVDKSLWQDAVKMAHAVKQLAIPLDGFRPIEEAISCAGGVKQTALNSGLAFNDNPALFACGEMLDWDAPTGGYLLTACFATGRAAGEGVHQYLQQL
jgi:uncharacterized flavoprotein (TIGR03862 family)